METAIKKLSSTQPKADSWFASGKRIPYNMVSGRIETEVASSTSLFVWNRVVRSQLVGTHSNWLTMMPGFPDGSYGWSSTEQYLLADDQSNRLFVEYVGMGDSDKPARYKYGVEERADMIEALWKHYEIEDTALITFDFSSLVAMELLNRQISRRRTGRTALTTISGVLLINGGYFADSHSHPIMTTPLLKTPFGRMGAKMAQNSSFAFNMMMKDLWSREYGITKKELAEVHNAIGRRNGTVFMSDAAGFVDEHKRNADRWDLKRIFEATYPDVKYIVAGSEKDQFEPRQLVKAQKELMHKGCIIERYPGGHMTTSEHPQLIANSIKKLKSII